MTRTKRSIREPAVSRRDVAFLHSLYRKYYEEQEHLKPTTKSSLLDRLLSFPKEPDDLNAEYFRRRMKTVSPYTVRAEVGLAKKFLIWAGRDVSGLDKKRLSLPRLEESVTVEDLYTNDELNAILANLDNYRDHAMISVLYESACRAGELVSMTCENLRFSPDSPIVTVFVTGKTGTREVYLKESVPSLQRWLDMHPTQKGPLWVDERIGHKPIVKHTLHNIVRDACLKAGLEKKKILHMFRHTRITELVRKGIRGQALSQLVGWTKRSNMESVYVHLSTSDVKNEIALKVFGLNGKEQPARPIFQNDKCPRCEHDNPSGIARCEKCGLVLKDSLIVEQLTQKSELEEQIANLQREQEGRTADLTHMITEYKRLEQSHNNIVDQYNELLDKTKALTTATVIEMLKPIHELLLDSDEEILKVAKGYRREHKKHKGDAFLGLREETKAKKKTKKQSKKKKETKKQAR